jgi:hypothetical protein
MTERFGLSVVIIYCAKQWEGAPSAAAPSIISCAIASIGAKSFTGGRPIPATRLSSTKERKAEAPQVMLAYHSQPSDDHGDQWPCGTGCELAVEEAPGDWRNSISPASRRNAIHSASFGMVLNRRVPSRVACSSRQPRAGSCLTVVKLEQLS